MEPGNLPFAPARAAAAGELVVLNGRQSGTRRALGVPTTFIGRAPRCDVRLNVEGVEAFHCVLTYHAGEASIRDLNSSHGTFVNGQRIAVAALRDGDLLDVGPFRFRVLLPAPRPTATALPARPGPEREAVRIQAAAIAAQQAALDELEAKLERERDELGSTREQLAAETQRLSTRSAALDQVRTELQYQQGDLAIRTVQLNTQRELDGRLLQDGWRCLDEERQRWRQRRNRESMVLRARRLLLIEGERKLAEMRTAVLREKQAWETQQHAIHSELHGLNNRIVHQRQRLQEHDEVHRAPAPLPEPDAPATDAAVARRSAQLDRMACALADQRAQLVEQWERLARVQRDWQERCEEAVSELEMLGQRLLRQEESLGEREHAVEIAENQLLQRQEQLERLRREAALALARAQAQQATWQAEREQVLAETTRLGEQARRQLDALGELRHKWNKRRRQETEAMRTERRACDLLRQELSRARQELEEQAHQLEAARRTLAEEVQALEDGTAESFDAGRGFTDRPSAPLRRRWLAQNAAVVRVLRRQREALAGERAALTALQQRLTAQAEQQGSYRAELAERQTALDYREASLAAGEARLAQEMRQIEQRRWSTERQLLVLQEETEHLARALIADGEPQPAPLERAA